MLLYQLAECNAPPLSSRFPPRLDGEFQSLLQVNGRPVAEAAGAGNIRPAVAHLPRLRGLVLWFERLSHGPDDSPGQLNYRDFPAAADIIDAGGTAFGRQDQGGDHVL